MKGTVTKFWKKCCVCLLVLVSMLTGCAYNTEKETAAEVKPTGNVREESYWVEKMEEGSKILMTNEEIEKYNTELMESFGEEIGIYDLEQFKDGITGQKLREWISESVLPSEGPYYSGAEELTDEFWKYASDNRNVDHIQEQPEVRWGVSTQRSSMRTFPVEEAVTDVPENPYDDLFQETAVLVNEPLAILHTSADGKFFYAVQSNYRGWIAVEDVGLCSGYDEWKEAQNGEFLVVTGSHVFLGEDPLEPSVSKKEFTMGVKIYLAESPGTVKEMRNRVSYDNYIGKVPVRSEDGMLEYKEAFIPVSSDVNVGYLEYSREAFLHQAFKTLGEVYGWGGMLNSRDCSSLVMEIYRCFGFDLPRNSSAMAMLPGEKNVDTENMEMNEKEEILKDMESGAILYFPGHIMIYLGEYDGEYYCMSATGNFQEEDYEGEETRYVHTITINTLDVKRWNGLTWMESLSKIVVIK